MEENMQEIIEAYRKGDLSERTGLFLCYRDLRGYFAAIDEAEALSVEAEVVAPSRRQRCLVCRLTALVMGKLGIVFG